MDNAYGIKMLINYDSRKEYCDGHLNFYTGCDGW